MKTLIILASYDRSYCEETREGTLTREKCALHAAHSPESAAPAIALDAVSLLLLHHDSGCPRWNAKAAMQSKAALSLHLDKEINAISIDLIKKEKRW
jgi:hypothetical protein